MKALAPFALCFAVLSAFGCSSKIGDSCNSSGDCSVNGERVCDLSPPGGYCTIQGCDPDTCPGSSICVEWRFMPSRTAETWCMESCESDKGCRIAYKCVRADEIDEDGNTPVGGVAEEDQIARVIDLSSKSQTRGFCVAR